MATGARHKSFVSAGTLYYRLNILGHFRLRAVALRDQRCAGTDWCLAVIQWHPVSHVARPEVGGRHHLYVLVARVLRDGVLQAFPSRRKATPRQFQAIDSRACAVASSVRASSFHP